MPVGWLAARFAVDSKIKPNTMKRLFALAALATGLTVLTADLAQAEHNSYESRRLAYRCGSCLTPVYRSLVVVGYHDCGEPIYRWRTSSHRCQSGRDGHGYGYDNHRSSRGYYRRPRVQQDYDDHCRGD